MNPSPADADGRVLGHLLAAQSALSMLTARQRMGEFVCRAVEGIPGVASCGVCLPGAGRPCFGREPATECADCEIFTEDIEHDPSHPCRLSNCHGVRAYSLKTLDRHFGFLVLQMKESGKYEPYEPFVANLASSLAVNVERQWQRDRLQAANTELQRHRKHLEELVRERTAEVERGLDRERHLTAVLRAVRNVNQLITREKDPDRLVRETCNILSQAREFRGVWVVRLDSDGPARAMGGAGIGNALADVRAQFEHDLIPECCRLALKSEDIVVVASPVRECGGCSMPWSCHDSAVLTSALRHQGKTYGVLVGAVPVEIADDTEERLLFGEVAGDLGFALYDIELAQQHRQGEEALRDSEGRYKAIFEGVAEGIVVADAETKCLLNANPAISRMLGYTAEELLALRLDDLHPREEQVRVAAEFEAQTRGLKSLACDIPCLRKDGKQIVMDICSANLILDGRRCHVGFYTDNTERSRITEQLRASQKMEAIGNLAGGIAHDFNNLLSVILNYTAFATDRLAESDPIRNDLLEVKKAAERAAGLTRQLLAFGRKQVLQPIPLDLNLVVGGIEKMLRRILGEDIELTQALEPELGLTLADIGQIEQVLMNLVVNARDAMPEGGNLAIETHNVDADEQYVSGHVPMKPGSYVQLAVTDTGIGMDDQTRARVFEPFFTTKERGKGTGLGLSTVYGIIKQSGGYIWIYSELGVGTTFKIYLPRELSMNLPAAVKHPTAVSPTRGTETILVVEDEDALRRAVLRALEGAGYTVVAARSGEDALRIARQHRGDIHLLLTDVVMPRMGGKELAEDLTRARPALKVLYMSGYSANAITRHGVLDSGMRLLAKPFTADELTRRVRDVLDGGSGRPAHTQAQAAEAVAGPEGQPHDEEALLALPYGEREKLREAVVAARYNEILDCIERIQTSNARAAAVLRRMLDQFDHEGMRKALGEGRSEGNER